MTQLQSTGPQGITANPFSHKEYTIKRNFWTLLGRDFQVLDPAGNLVMYVRHKFFSFKDEWTVSTDSSQKVPLLRVKAREVVALNLTSDVMDAPTGAVVGTVRSRGLRSIFSDAWDVLDANGGVVGELVEDSNALFRRVLPTFFGMPIIPGRWHLGLGGSHAMEINEQRTLFVKTFKVTLVSPQVDARFAIGCALLALMREIMREK